MDNTIEIEPQIINHELIGLQQQLKDLAESVESLRLQLDAQSRALADLEAEVHETKVLSRAATKPQTSPAEASINPETLIAIVAAVTMFLGKKVRIRSARMMQSPYEIVNPWAQQGRVNVQASHALGRW